ncbi:MAG: hypothetical protein ABIZ50_06775, partial [Solirubrobacterales bacterium]
SGSKHKVKYTFSSDEAGSTFECRFDKLRFRPCKSPNKLRARPGKHSFQVRATDAAENTDLTPAKDKFKVQ